MAGSEVRNAILEKGLDPAISFIHAVQSGRESLVFDVMEPVRPKVDWFALQLLKSNLNLKCFTMNKQDGCLLNKEGRNRFYKAWAIWQGGTAKERSMNAMAQDTIQGIIDFFPKPDPRSPCEEP